MVEERRILRFWPLLLGLGLAALAAGWVFVGLYGARLAGHDSIPGSILSFDEESSIPSWVSSSLLLLLGIMTALAAMGAPGRRARLVWIVATVILGLMSMDEAVSIHERSYRLVRVFGLSTDWMWAFGFAWVPLAIPVLVLLAVFGWVMRHDIPTETWIGIAGAAAVFVAGALLIEIVGGRFSQGGNAASRTYAVLTAIEETLEIVGLLLAGRTLDRHLQATGPVVLMSPTPDRLGADAGPDAATWAGRGRATGARTGRLATRPATSPLLTRAGGRPAPASAGQTTAGS